MGVGFRVSGVGFRVGTLGSELEGRGRGLGVGHGELTDQHTCSRR